VKTYRDAVPSLYYSHMITLLLNWS